MRNVTKNQLKKAIFMRLCDFETTIENAMPEVTVSYCEETLFYDRTDEKTVEQDEIYDALSKYFKVTVTSVHTDNFEDVGVWIVYKDDSVPDEVPCSECYNSRFDSEAELSTFTKDGFPEEVIKRFWKDNEPLGGYCAVCGGEM